MEPPFCNPRYQPRYRHRLFPKRSAPAQTTPSKPSVRSIPIMDGDEATLQRKQQPVRSQPDSAVKIQKAFRGYRVRNTVKKILELKREVDTVERKLQEEATWSVIKRDGMEKMKASQSLMILLFKLDPIREFNDETRAFRKAVIRKAIVLQELINSATDDDATVVEGGEEVDYGVAKDHKERKSAVKGRSYEDWCVVKDEDEDEENRKKEILLEKMVVDNQKLMVMMNDLFEQFSEHKRMIWSLSQRVEHLEMAMNDRFWNKIN